MIGFRAAAKGSGDGKYHAYQYRCGDDNEQSYKNLIALSCHHVLFPCQCPSQAAVLCEHLQIIHFARNFRLGHTVEELPQTRLGAGTHFRGRAHGH